MAKKVEVDAKLIIAAVAFVIIATVGSAFATYLIFRGSSSQAAVGREVATAKKEMGPTYPVGEFTLNLASTSNQRRFIRTEIVLEASDKKVVTELENRQPQIRDQLISLLRSRTAEELSTEKGMEVLRFDILTAVNEFITRGEVTNVFFIDLIVQ
ncbi:MAG: hypothetical protein GX971_07330 [Firmicutes bacterium]|nr:hypothetical protein [Bacillota bacterium]